MGCVIWWDDHAPAVSLSSSTRQGADMPKRRVFDVSPDGDGWKVEERGGSQRSHHRTKDAAVGAGRRAARKSGNSQLVIRKRDGTIQEERTYGNDPYPPRG